MFLEATVSSFPYRCKEVTIVTACDCKHVEHLQVTYLNWCLFKNIDQYPMIVYVNGMGIDDTRLDFLRKHPDLRLIPWDMTVDTQRERMLSCFVLGTAKDVKTDYWLKLDADAYMTDSRPMLDESMFQADICGHKWHYTKPGAFLSHLDAWADTRAEFAGTERLFGSGEEVRETRRFGHSRFASYVCLHKAEFSRFAAGLCQPENRLPVPSHDTFMWYVEARLGRKWERRNFKRDFGVNNKSKIEPLKNRVKEAGKCV